MMGTKQVIEATCPECRGPLSEVETANLTEYRCLVGHAYSQRALLEAHSETQERALWTAVVALEEASEIVRAVKQKFPPEIAERLQRQADRRREQAAQIRKILEQLEPFHFE